jgi:glycosyltransferase involved in cell wall biosynthesis
MKVLMLTSFEHPHTGGMSTHMDLIEKGLKTNNFQVETLSISNVNILLRKVLFSAPCKILNIFQKDLGTFWVFLMNELFLYLLLLLRIISGEKYDVINCQDALAAKVAVRLKGISDFKVILTAHGYFVMQATSDGCLTKDSFVSKKYIEVEKKAYMNVDSIISVDNRIKDYILNLTGNIKKPKITVLKNFIDTSIFKIENYDKNSLRRKWKLPEKKFIIFCPRRLVPKNGVIYPILALLQLKNYEDILIVYAGSGQEKVKMEKLVKENSLQDKVIMLGNVDHKSIVELYNLSDVVIVPSINSEGVEEATSISAIEGMACSKVVIASNIGGLKELIKHEQNGILYGDKDINELVNAILLVYGDSDKRVHIEKNARKTVEDELSLENRIKDYIQIFKNVKLN